MDRCRLAGRAERKAVAWSKRRGAGGESDAVGEGIAEDGGMGRASRARALALRADLRPRSCARSPMETGDAERRADEAERELMEWKKSSSCASASARSSRG